MKWVALVPASKRPAVLNNNHNDWWGPFKFLPRAVSAFFGKPPSPATWWAVGSWTWAKPIPAPGKWIVRFWPWPYFALQTKSYWLIRGLFFWDDNDNYYNLGFTIKREASPSAS